MHDARTRAPFRGAALLVTVLLVAGLVRTAAAQQLDCGDIDHDCDADRYTASGIKKAGSTLIRCVKEGVDPCDLGLALARVTSPDCRFAIECELRDLFDRIGDGSTSCVQGLFKEAYTFMSKKATRIDHEQNFKIPEDLARCKEKGGRRCEDPVAPPLTGDCTGDTTPLAAADCMCTVADKNSDLMLLTPATCSQPPLAPSPASPAALLPRSSGRPNLILILTDDQRWDTVGLEHSRDGVTPVMPHVVSELADSGVTFPNGFVTTALCCPSRSSILTGEYSHNTGIHTNGGSDGGFANFDDTSTIATWLQAAGYRTALVGKYLNGYATGSPCIPPGWDEWHVFVQVKYYDYDFNDNGVVTRFGTAPADYSQNILTQRALQFIDDSAGRPFFLYFAPKAPHAPATPRPDHIGLFAGLPAFRPPNYAVRPTNGPAWVQALKWTALDQSSTDQFRIDQLESLQAVDEAVRDIMQKLRDIGEDDNTLVIFTGDNGYSWGSHRWKPKQCPYQECMRVPMIMRYPPGGTTPRVDTRPVLNIDFAPTFAELATATIPPTHLVNGVSVVPLLTGTPVTWRADFLNEHWGGKIPDDAQVQDSQHKYTEYYAEPPPIETELYDLSVDPYELHNVTGDPGYAGVKAALKARLDALRAE
jgi:N-acetylglucosamine-6-sulfatase